MSMLHRLNGAIDNLVGVFSPEAELSRIRNRQATTMLRGYDAAGDGWSNPFNMLRNTTAGTEASKNNRKLTAVGQELTRNNALANRIKSQWASNVVGSGITLDLTSKKKKKQKGKAGAKAAKFVINRFIRKMGY